VGSGELGVRSDKRDCGASEQTPICRSHGLEIYCNGIIPSQETFKSMIIGKIIIANFIGDKKNI